MFTSTEQFYKSDIWQLTRKQIIQSRLNKKGETIDEYTGKPIALPYDIIVHHKIELTPENVNDASISLNPDNLMIVSFDSHNKIHERFGYHQKKVYLVFGSPCSGKSTYVRNVAKKSDVIVDLDKIGEMISVNDIHVRPNALKSMIFSIRDTMYDQIKTRNGNWVTAFIIVTMPRCMERKRLCDLLGAEEIYIETDKETCLQRLYNNPNGRDISEYEEYINNFFENYQPSE